MNYFIKDRFTGVLRPTEKMIKHMKRLEKANLVEMPITDTEIDYEALLKSYREKRNLL